MNRRGFFSALTGLGVAGCIIPIKAAAPPSTSILSAKDMAERLSAFWKTAETEMIGLTPKVPYIDSASEFGASTDAFLAIIPKIYEIDWVNWNEVGKRLGELK